MGTRGTVLKDKSDLRILPERRDEKETKKETVKKNSFKYTVKGQKNQKIKKESKVQVGATRQG